MHDYKHMATRDTRHPTEVLDMTKTEATICRHMFYSGAYIATSERKADKAWEVLRKVLGPHGFRCIDESDKFGTYVMKFERV